MGEIIFNGQIGSGMRFGCLQKNYFPITGGFQSSWEITSYIAKIL